MMLNILKKIFPPDKNSGHSPFWQAVTYSLPLMISIIAGVMGFNMRTGVPAPIMGLLWLIGSLSLFLIIRLFLGWMISNPLVKLPNTFVYTAVTAALTYFLYRHFRSNLSGGFFEFSGNQYLFYSSLFYFVLNALLFGLIWVSIDSYKKKKSFKFHLIAVAIILFLDVYGISYLAGDGDSEFEDYTSYFNQIPRELAGIEDPSVQGEYEYEYFTYGSGLDTRREAYGKDVKFTTTPVDGTRLLPDWKGSKAKWRKLYWGFGADSFPLNGRVWFPEGSGPFPLILIVHGNHSMEHYSDPGYTYLGELLASRGFITVSVDENFINGTWSGDFRGREMPTRAWLLLKHLEIWREWNNDTSHELNGKIDLDKIVLAGHSRGGEAVPIAAAYNKLAHFPDDANEKFDFNFNIKGLIAIAPTDKRYHRRIELENINYLSLQGSYDSDEASFFGLRQSQRIHFNDSNSWLKAGIYIHGANHGQFNSIWGRKDSGAPWNWLLNLAPIMKGEDQRQLAKVMISAFSELIFNGKTAYSSLFKAPGYGYEFFPKVPVLTSYWDSDHQGLVDFEDDIDLTTWKMGNLEATGFQVWREEEILFRDRDTQSVNGLVLGWDYGDTMEPDSLARYTIHLKDSVKFEAHELVLNLSSYQNSQQKDGAFDPIDFSIILTDSLGTNYSGKLTDFGQVFPPFQIKYLKPDKLNDDIYKSRWEPSLQDVRIDLNALSKQDSFDFQTVRSISLVFDQSKKGTVLINKIGLAK